MNHNLHFPAHLFIIFWKYFMLPTKEEKKYDDLQYREITENSIRANINLLRRNVLSNGSISEEIPLDGNRKTSQKKERIAAMLACIMNAVIINQLSVRKPFWQWKTVQNRRKWRRRKRRENRRKCSSGSRRNVYT